MGSSGSVEQNLTLTVVQPGISISPVNASVYFVDGGDAIDMSFDLFHSLESDSDAFSIQLTDNTLIGLDPWYSIIDLRIQGVPQSIGTANNGWNASEDGVIAMIPRIALESSVV